MDKLENKIYEINNNVFLLDFNLTKFSYQETIFFEIKGNKSAFNSSNIYIQNSSEIQLETYKRLDTCNKSEKNSEIILYCNYTKYSKNNIVLMLLLNGGKKINIRNFEIKREWTRRNK